MNEKQYIAWNAFKYLLQVLIQSLVELYPGAVLDEFCDHRTIEEDVHLRVYFYYTVKTLIFFNFFVKMKRTAFAKLVSFFVVA